MRIGEVSTLDMKVAFSLSFVYVIITSYFPLCSGSYKGTKCSYRHGEDLLRELNPPKHFAKFFDPDCEKRKLIFRPDKQGCLGALRWLEEFVGPNKTFGKFSTPFFNRIACSHRTCKDLPLFRKCGSNEPNKANPRWFRNGCRQCAASCKEVVAGRRRYARLGYDECPKFYKGHTPDHLQKTPPYQTIRPTTRKDLSRQKGGHNATTSFKIKQTTTVATTTTESTLASTSTAQTTAADSTLKLTTEGITTMLPTTELMTTMAECDDVKLPVRKVPTTVYCVSNRVKCKVNCSSIKEFENEFKLPRLPSWQPKETNDG